MSAPASPGFRRFESDPGIQRIHRPSGSSRAAFSIFDLTKQTTNQPKESK